MASIESVTLEVADPTAAHRFYTAAFGFGPQVRLRASEAPTTGFRGFTLYGRGALAKDVGISPDGTGSHRLMIGSDAGPFTDPDGFGWEAAPHHSHHMESPQLPTAPVIEQR
jgi:catechol 2,3-dioxygenase-like lactoylglutathione lyase family enzyme